MSISGLIADITSFLSFFFIACSSFTESHVSSKKLSREQHWEVLQCSPWQRIRQLVFSMFGFI
jgi:hypothetical protein